ncbi:hypothetical protein [Proteiniclasticum ruminis]|uniref:hypothetical protein n=1 Tax=Proteiniclasticum ruminis TaxID=398199 RepID=UPI0028ADCBCF|nr:hypothetical protein [Proteiniclasticum ruminis]
MKQRTLGIILLFLAVVLFYYFVFTNDTFLIFAMMLIMVLWLQLSGGWKPKRKSEKK